LKLLLNNINKYKIKNFLELESFTDAANFLNKFRKPTITAIKDNEDIDYNTVRLRNQYISNGNSKK